MPNVKSVGGSVCGSRIRQSLLRVSLQRGPSFGSSRGAVSSTALLPAVLIAVTLAAPVTLAQDAASRFKRYDASAPFKPVVKPQALNGGGRVKMVVVMSEEPVALARERAATQKLSFAERKAVRDRVAAQQASAEHSIVARGGTVLRRYHNALNGIKVEIDRKEAAALASLPGVQEVVPVGIYKRHNTVGVPYIGAPAVWEAVPGLRGEGVKIAIIDTGIDFTHANFGGPGTAAAFQAAFAASTAPADPALFGPNALKVKGGTDLVGDAYDAGADPGSPALTPQPDPNPLDCNGHGSHVAGTAAGFGVTAAGTYAGPYNSAAYQQTTFKIGPGVAPKADLYAVRVFGCDGSTDVVTEAIDWAVENDMDVINMSLGSPFGTARDASALAARNAARAGVLVVASSGNSGPAPYITGAPASGAGVISVAAVDSTQTFPAATLQLNGTSITAINANGATLPGGALPVHVLRNANGSVSLGCDEAEYVDALIAGRLVVTRRGVCARVDRAIFGQRHGAAAVAMINNSPGYPPFEGEIAGVTIPFLGIQPSDATALLGATTASLAATTLANPAFRRVADFSSGGPRFGDSVLKPNVAAPGVAILSTMVGGGTDGERNSGTSMSAPHVAGAAALVLQAHPNWSRRALTAAIVQTADPGQVDAYGPRLAGAGLVQPLGGTRTQTVAAGEDGTPGGVSFGFEELLSDFHESRKIELQNLGSGPVSFNVTATPTSGAPHTVQLNRSTITIGGHDDAKLGITLRVPAATVGGTHDNAGNVAFREVGGYLTFTPVAPNVNGGVSLHVPYYLVPRARSNLLSLFHGRAISTRHPSGNVRLLNPSGVTTGIADFYAWGLRSAPQGVPFFDVRAVGVQTIPIAADDTILVFALNTHERFSNAAAGEFDILIDTNGDGTADYAVVGIDLGAVTAGSFNGQLASAVFNLTTGDGVINFLADAPTDGSTVLLPLFASDLGLTPASPRFSYSVQVFNLLDGSSAAVPGVARFNAFTPSISNAMFVPVAPNASTTVPVSIDGAEWTQTPALGLMVVTQDNRAGAPQARLLEVRQ